MLHVVEGQGFTFLLSLEFALPSDSGGVCRNHSGTLSLNAIPRAAVCACTASRACGMAVRHAGSHPRQNSNSRRLGFRGLHPIEV